MQHVTYLTNVQNVCTFVMSLWTNCSLNKAIFVYGSEKLCLSPTPVSQPELYLHMSVLEDTDTLGNEEDIGTVLEEVVKDSLTQTVMYKLHTICSLTLKSSLPLFSRAFPVCSLTLLHLDVHLLGTKITIECYKTFPVYRQNAV